MQPRLILTIAFLCALMLGAVWGVGTVSTTVALSQLEKSSSERVRLYRTTLENALSRLRHLPLVISRHHAVGALLLGQDVLQDVRDYLTTAATASDASVIYLLDPSGKTIASSNWSKKESFEGHNYGFRPYFKDALDGREGRFFAVGVTTKRPGYFISRAIYTDDIEKTILGVVVVKVELEALQTTWRDGGEKVMVSNAEGIVISASNKNWLYRTLNPLSHEVRERLIANRTFTKQSIKPLEITYQTLAARPVMHFSDGERYFDIRSKLSEHEWTMHYLANARPIISARWIAMAFAAGTILFFGVALLYYRERLRKKALVREAQDATRIKQINTELAGEIEVRRQAESDLQAAQEELILASKMAALGRMSAAIAHEVNQPISAIRTFASSGKLLIERENYNAAEQTFNDIADVIARLSTITGDLKLFARTTNEQTALVSLHDAIRAVFKTFKSEFKDSKVEIIEEMTEEAMIVTGSEHRVEQVLSNIIRNALDAMSDKQENPRLKISLLREEEEAVLRIEDNGPGIASDVLEHVFDPFVTTKPVEQGVGLGLAISYGLIEDMGGTLRARNVEGGAVFSVRLKLADEARHALKAAE
ncbi:MAG: ATP-binding protein [Hyphomicrobiales bacterium]